MRRIPKTAVPSSAGGAICQRGLPELLGLLLTSLGRRVHGSVVHPGDAIKARTHEEGRQDNPCPQATHLELVRGKKRDLSRRRRRSKQQSQSGDQKILRI